MEYGVSQNEISKACALYFSERIPVVSRDGRPLMPCRPAKARKLLSSGKAEPRWSKLGLFYIQLGIDIKSEYNGGGQSFVLAHDPGSKFDGMALGCKFVQLRFMVILPQKVAGKMKNRRELRRGRRYRNCRRRPYRPRSPGPYWIAPTQLAKVLFRLAVVEELCRLFPISHFIVEDVRFNHFRFRHGKHFSTAEIGKTRYYSELCRLGVLVLVEGWQTKLWREGAGLKKVTRKDALIPGSHANDAVAMLWGLAGCGVNEGAPFYVLRRPEFARRSLHRQNFQKGCVRSLFGGTSNGSFLRKGDYVEAEKAGKVYRGWVCGLPTETTPLVGVMDARGVRIGQFAPGKVRLLQRGHNILWERVM
ncbi:RRXRR protein [Thermanaeromonas toyohensis ToBE]|uniref:RRXRR protein n=1 Tax=Thermanaeromonas toyohensis ToBE TaxID=698762 RepID=A0A1W1VTB1_9FIRM|nr:RRXRR domain-containing protein [Thermanaeromonas toyohensis]SMB96470.1 RRXRR protein [Thermanaeromonas toyohensis ToBE]